MRRVLIGAAAVVAVLALLFGVVIPLTSGTITSQAAAPPPAAAKIEGTGTPAPWPCPANMVQHFDPNEKGNLSSTKIEDTPQLLGLAGRDARALGAYALQLKLVAKNDPEPLLTPGNACLSQEGQSVWNQMKGALTAAGVKEERTEAPANWHNTAMVNGQFVVDPQPGIGGDRSALSYTLRNGDKFVVMQRCGNPVLPSPGNLPQGPTDHQRPPSPPAVPPRERECCTPTSPPPSGDNDAKKPHEAPGNGGPGDGGASLYGGTGSDRQRVQGSPSAPAAGDPPPTYQAPAPPTAAPSTPPTGSTPVPNPQPAPPPEDGANPGDGGGNEGDPGGF